MKNYGYIEDEIKLDNYILGSVDTTKTLKGKVLVPSGQWTPWLPVKELQRKNWVETSNCTAFGTLNALEILHKMKYNKEKNWCERYLGIVAGTTSRGNSAHTVAETIRQIYGCINESNLPFDSTITSLTKYYSPKPITQNYITLGQNWLQEYDFGHEWVFNGWHTIQEKQKRLREALTHSPVGISVDAWHKRGDLYVKVNKNDNHWCTLYGYVEGEYWKIFDSYDNTEKKIAWNYNFGFAKKYQLKKKLINMLKTELNKIYNELLVRGWKESTDGLGYLNHDEDFVRKEVGKSAERKQIIKLVEWARKWKVLNMFSGK